MATSTTCPLCGQRFALSGGSASGPVTCPNPSCAHTFDARTPATASGLHAVAASTSTSTSTVVATTAVAAGPMAARNGQRPPGAGPELLDRVPTSFWVSPPMISVGGVSVLLYGMVLFAVVSARRNMPEPEPPPRPPLVFAPIRNTAPTKSEPTKSVRTPGAIAAPEKKAAEPGKTAETAATAATAPDPKPDSRKPEPAKAVAAVMPAPVPTVVKPPEPPKPETWGLLAGFPGDCQYRVEGPAMTIQVPGTLHILSPDLKVKNAPRLLTEVRGDFTAQVTVPGRIMPGTEPLPNFPFTFQGAGLLVWQDENNYLRFERTSIFSVDRKRLHQVIVEVCRDGQIVKVVPVAAKDADIMLKLVRTASEVRCQYNPDGKNWVDVVKRQPVTFSANVMVGVSASNASPKPLAARLENFDLSGGGVKPK